MTVLLLLRLVVLGLQHILSALEEEGIKISKPLAKARPLGITLRHEDLRLTQYVKIAGNSPETDLVPHTQSF